MGTTRRPKGTYVRPASDFFIHDTAMVGATYLSNAHLDAAIELFNNATDGSYLHVYKVMLGNDGQGWYLGSIYHGNLGSNATQPFSVVSNRARPWGMLYAGDLAPLYPGSNPVSGSFFSGYLAGESFGGSSDQWMAPGPIAVLAPGYSLQYRSNIGTLSTGGGILDCTFYYMDVPDQG
jgi:hypothetical protein